MVPSAVHLLENPGLLDRLGAWPPVASRLFLGRRALIGRLALERNREAAHPAFVPTFKAALSSEATRPLARLGRHAVTAREVARAFLRELLVATKHATGERIRDLVVTSPVSAFETYRAEVQQRPAGARRAAGALRGRAGGRRPRLRPQPLARAHGPGRRHRRRDDARGARRALAAGRHGRRGARPREAGATARRQRGGRLGARGGLPPGGLPAARRGGRRERAVLAAPDAGRGLPREGGGALRRDRGLPRHAPRLRPLLDGRAPGLLAADLHPRAAGRAARDERLLPRARRVPRRDVRGRARPGRGRGRRAAGGRLDAAARGLRAPRAAVRAAADAGLAAVRGGGLRRRLLRRRPHRDARLHRPRLRVRHPRRADGRAAAHGDRAARHALPDAARTSGSGSSCRPARSASRSRSSGS